MPMPEIPDEPPPSKTTKLTPIDQNTTVWAERLVQKIRRRGWAGAVAVVGMNGQGGHSATGAGTGLDLSADAMGALEVFLNVGKYFRESDDLPRLNELHILVRDRINTVWPELLGQPAPADGSGLPDGEA